MDIELAPLTAETTRLTVDRLCSVAQSVRGLENCVAWVPPELAEQMAIDGYGDFCSVYGRNEKLDDPHQLAVNFATHVNSGRFRVAQSAAAKSATLPLVSALSFQPQERIESHFLRLAILYGVALGLSRT